MNAGRTSARLLFLMTAVTIAVVGCVMIRPSVRELPADPDGVALMQTAQRMISAYHQDAPVSGDRIRVVYFHPRDRDPLPAYAERLDRTLQDVSDFYRDGLRRFGLATDGLPFERRDGRLLLHVVRGKHPATAYRHESGDEIADEITSALAGIVDPARDHILVLYALCHREPDGRYVFNAPYYGSGSQRNGLCHAADCELLDPGLLRDTNRRIVYTEHYFARVEQTLATFNSWYLGGIAHELGHGLGLAHDAGSWPEATGTSLMGGGNHTYRQEIWGGGAPTFLSRASALQLASHPLFTHSNRGRWAEVGAGIVELAFSLHGNLLHVDGRATGSIDPYAVVAYTWPAKAETDHGARTYPTVCSDGRFHVEIEGLRGTDLELKLVTFHVNGGTTTRPFQIRCDASGRPDVNALNRAWTAERASALNR